MNTVLFAGIAATLEVIIGTAIAYIFLRTGIFGPKGLDYLAPAALAVPGIVFNIGYLRVCHSIDVPFTGEAMASWWVIMALALMIRRHTLSRGGKTHEQPGIKIENLDLWFGDTEVLKGVVLEIQPGEFSAFLGPSGSGKSTLLRAIAGFGPNPSGRILIGKRDVVGLDPWKLNVGMVFQSYALWPHMSVRDDVGFGLRERKVPSAQIKTKVDAALNLVGLEHLADRMPNQLSGGQQQRIGPTRTVVVEPQVLLLDEPLSILDASLRVQMRRELLRLQRQLDLTTIFVTHDQEKANATYDRMAVLDGGVI